MSRKSNLTFTKNEKKSLKPTFVSALEHGLNRRAFLRLSGAATMVASLAACKPNSVSSATKIANQSEQKSNQINTDKFEFTKKQRQTLAAVQLHLFPDDGDGPSAKDINALAYLEWALTDPDNAADGDGEFIVKGIGWLDDLSKSTQGTEFINLATEQKEKVFTQISRSSAGENWLSLLLYYISEALMLDPFYGGNPDGIGWKWLKHQPGFPAPDETTHYRRFL